MGIMFLIIFLVRVQVPEATIRNSIHNAGPFGVLLLILFFWISHVIAPLSGSPFLFVGFYLYGQTVVIYTLIAALIASVTNFWIARIWGRSLVKHLAGDNALEKIDKFTKDYGLQTLFVFRLFLGGFHDVISYAFGLTTLKFWTYFTVSTLGMIPSTILWYFVSSKIKSPLSFTIISWIIAYITLSVYILHKKLHRNKLHNILLKLRKIFKIKK